LEDANLMKNSQAISPKRRHFVRLARRYRIGAGERASTKLLHLLPSVMAVLVFSTLVFYLTLGTAGSPVSKEFVPGDQTGAATIDQYQSTSLLPVELDFEDIPLYNRSANQIFNNEPSPSLSEPTALPQPTAAPSPSPYPRMIDAAGNPQEVMPVSDFYPDDTVFYVKVNQANGRELPNTSAQIVFRLKMGDKITRTGYGIDWSCIKTASGKTGYVLTSLMTTTFVPKPTPTPTPKPTAKPTPKPTPKPTVTPSPVGSTLTDEQKQAIVDMARSFLGTRYVYGAMSPSVGFDCSGLTSYIYKTLFHVTLPRSARDQAKAGVAVSHADIEIGDILCFDWDSPSGVCDHVGIYIGGGHYIHASYHAGKVVESTVTFGQTPVISIRRIIH
jgi:cell wall-associated NlpC family hydrolase